MENSDQSPRFEGEAKRIRLVSNSIGFGKIPEPDTEVEQHLTIVSDGRVFFSSYQYGDGIKYIKTGSGRGKIAPETAQRCLELIGKFFASPGTNLDACDVGNWVLGITNANDTTFLFRGALCFMDVDLAEISEELREVLDMPQLYAFDGECAKDRIEKLSIDYDMADVLQSSDEKQEEVELSYQEKIYIDRKAGVVVQMQEYGNGFDCTKEFHARSAVCELLTDLYSENLFKAIPDYPPNPLVNPRSHREYQICVEFLYAPPRRIIGTFDKNGLPKDYPQFAEKILKFIQHFCSAQEVLSPTVYRSAQRRINDYIYLSVIFSEFGKEYYYRTTDGTLAPGDLCIVPAGRDNHDAIARIVSVEYFAAEDVPLPLEKTKVAKERYESKNEEQ